LDEAHGGGFPVVGAIAFRTLAGMEKKLRNQAKIEAELFRTRLPKTLAIVQNFLNPTEVSVEAEIESRGDTEGGFLIEPSSQTIPDSRLIGATRTKRIVHPHILSYLVAQLFSLGIEIRVVQVEKYLAFLDALSRLGTIRESRIQHWAPVDLKR
jgi:hypothetical protein